MITIQTFIFNPFQVNTYLIYDQTSECIIVDPGCQNETERDKLVSFIKRNELIPVAILQTHGHIDHILGNKSLKDLFKIPIYGHADDNKLVAGAEMQALFFGLEIEKPYMPDRFLSDHTTFRFGQSNFLALHVPGHSPGSLVFYCKDENFILSGDVLFYGTIGRTDLPGGSFETLIHGIRNKLFILPDETKVYPGHGSPTFIGNEKKLPFDN